MGEGELWLEPPHPWLPENLQACSEAAVQPLGRSSPHVARVVDWVPRRPGLGLSVAADVDALGEWLSLSEPQASYL